ncbi:MAG TPA: hypothetical protein VFR96_06680 [Povalibacter sp.]|jgi:hypothetical protein|nr:hypothetical protein [Povalibacter sp.]
MLYCRDLPKNVKLKANDGRNVELIAFQHGVGVDSFWYMPASAGWPLFVILDTADANAVMKKFVSFGAASFDDLLSAGSTSSGDEAPMGVISAIVQGSQRCFLGSFKLLAGAFASRLQSSAWLMPADGVYEVTVGPTYAIKGSAGDLARQFLQFMVDAQK